MPTMKPLRKKLEKQSPTQELQKTKYLGINITQEVKDLFKKNYSTLKKRDIRRQQKMERHPC